MVAVQPTPLPGCGCCLAGSVVLAAPLPHGDLALAASLLRLLPFRHNCDWLGRALIQFLLRWLCSQGIGS